MIASIKKGLASTYNTTKSEVAAAQRKNKSRNSHKAVRIAFDEAPSNRSLSDAKLYALRNAELHIPNLSKSSCANLFDELQHYCRAHSKWSYIRREQGSLRLNEFGQTSTWQAIISMLKERATESFEQSRELHGLVGMHEDFQKIETLVDYDETRTWSIFNCGLPSGASERAFQRMQAAADACDEIDDDR